MPLLVSATPKTTVLGCRFHFCGQGVVMTEKVLISGKRAYEYSARLPQSMTGSVHKFSLILVNAWLTLPTWVRAVKCST